MKKITDTKKNTPYNAITEQFVGTIIEYAKRGEVGQAVRHAIDIGYRHFDCAHVYGNEREVGKAINSKICEGVVCRGDLFITSKLWNTFHNPKLVHGALCKTLEDLQLSYLDLYLIHWPQGYKEGRGLFPKDNCGDTLFSDVDYVDTWRAMEPVAEECLTRNIGVSNFNSKQITRVLQVAKIKPVTNQVECHPYLNQCRLKNFCEERGILLTAYSPLGSPDRPWAKADEAKLMDDPKIRDIAQGLCKTVAQVLIRYQIDRGLIVIPKSVNPERIQANFDVFDFKLSDDDIAFINCFDRNRRFVPLTEDDGKRPDGMSLIPWKMGRVLVWDATCSDTLAPSHLHGTNNIAGAACEAAEKAKACKYRGLGSEYDFVPFGVETLGPWGPNAIKLFKEIAKRLVDITGD